jgi:hypothetical protein
VRTHATKEAVGDPTRLLRRADAPSDLIEWTAGRPLDVVWDECPRGDWLLWLSAISKVPCVALVEAAVACATAAVRSVPKSKKRRVLRAALASATVLDSSAQCREHADACDTIAGDVAAKGYRELHEGSFEWAAAAAAGAARAAEALLVAQARRVAERNTAGQHRPGAMGLDILVQLEELPPLAFDHEDELSAMCVYAAARSIGFAARALAPPGAPGEAHRAVELELSEIAFDILDPVREGLREGKAASELVRATDIEVYAPSQATRQKLGVDHAPIQIGKKPFHATIASLIVPVGGCGHLFAGATRAGSILFLGGLVGLFGFWGGVLSPATWAILLLVDLVMGPRLVRQHHEGRLPTVDQQTVFAVVTVVVAVVAGFV